MMSSCIRCPSHASALLTYDHAAAEAYLDDATGTERVHEGMLLCSPHARRFTAPVGWDVVDRRDGGPSTVASESIS